MDRLPRLISVVVMVALFSPIFSATAMARFYQADPEIAVAYKSEMLDLFVRGEYGRLEDIASELRTTKARMPGGTCRLQYFYSGISSPAEESDANYIEMLAGMDEWMERYPDSLTARVAKADALIGFAWLARGSGYANTVTEKGWILFRKRLERAYDLLAVEPRDKSGDCPMRYELLIVVGMALGFPDAECEQYFREGIDLDPDFQGIYFRNLRRLLPKWGGSEGEWQRFADKSIQYIGKEEGMAMYTRLLWWAHMEKTWYPPCEDGISWSKMKQGFRDIERDYPGSEWNLNIFAAFAFMFQDFETFAELAERIGDNPNVEVWNSVDTYNDARRVAGLR